jgi:hypothetical protein
MEVRYDNSIGKAICNNKKSRHARPPTVYTHFYVLTWQDPDYRSTAEAAAACVRDYQVATAYPDVTVDSPFMTKADVNKDSPHDIQWQYHASIKESLKEDKMTETKTTADTPRPKNWVAGISDVEFESVVAPDEIIQNVGHIVGEDTMRSAAYYADYNHILNSQKRDRISAVRNQEDPV